jgi:ectoine hydroxylase-related dioxygenase (phytanoyl-CoA dioxygenase family)
LAAAKADLDTHGYCILADALSASQIEALRTRITDRAEADWAMGLAHQDHAQPGGIN